MLFENNMGEKWLQVEYGQAACLNKNNISALQYIFFTINLENTKIDYFSCHKPPFQWGHYGYYQTVICMVLWIVYRVVL